MRILFLMFLMFCVPCFAAQKCVDFSELEKTGPDSIDAVYDRVDWTIVYPHITIRGLGVCSDQAGEYGDVTDVLRAGFLQYDPSGLYGATNTYCWCRVISPAVSSWIMYEDYGDPEACIELCATDCWVALMEDSAYRNKVINSFSLE